MIQRMLRLTIPGALVLGCSQLTGALPGLAPADPTPETSVMVAAVPSGVTPSGSALPSVDAPPAIGTPVEPGVPEEAYDPFADERPLSQTGFAIPPTVQHVTETTAQILFQLETPQPGTLFYRAVTDAPGPVQSLRLDMAHERQFWTLEPLTPGRSYEFLVRLGSGEDETLEDVPFLGERWGPQTFRTPPYDAPLRFTVIGDSGFAEPVTFSLVEQMADFDPHFVLHVGDLVYRPEENSDPYEAYQQKFYRPFFPVLRRAPFYPAVGNHDVNERGSMLSGLPFYYWAFPPVSDTQFPASAYGDLRKWYAFAAGDVQFISLDTQTFFGDAGHREQLAWLEGRLADPRFVYSVVFFHVPPYTSGFHRGEMAAMQPLASLLEGARVPVAFSGHDHDYERLSVGPTTYFVTGGGSQALYKMEEVHPNSAFYARQSHFLQVEAGSDLIEVRAIAADGSVIDRVSLPTPP